MGIAPVRVQVPPRVRKSRYRIFGIGFFNVLLRMAQVYILYSKKIDHFYIGSCKDFDQQLWNIIMAGIEIVLQKELTTGNCSLLFQILNINNQEILRNILKKWKVVNTLRTWKDIQILWKNWLKGINNGFIPIAIGTRLEYEKASAKQLFIRGFCFFCDENP